MQSSQVSTLRIGLLSLVGAVVVACACFAGCTINPQPLPPGPDPAPQNPDPGGTGSFGGGGSDKNGGDTTGAAGLGAEGGAEGGADGGDAGKGDSS